MAAKSCCNVSSVTGELWLDEVKLVLDALPEEPLVELVGLAELVELVGEVDGVLELLEELELLPKID